MAEDKTHKTPNRDPRNPVPPPVKTPKDAPTENKPVDSHPAGA